MFKENFERVKGDKTRILGGIFFILTAFGVFVAYPLVRPNTLLNLNRQRAIIDRTEFNDSDFYVYFHHENAMPMYVEANAFPKDIYMAKEYIKPKEQAVLVIPNYEGEEYNIMFDRYGKSISYKKPSSDTMALRVVDVIDTSTKDAIKDIIAEDIESVDEEIIPFEVEINRDGEKPVAIIEVVNPESYEQTFIVYYWITSRSDGQYNDEDTIKRETFIVNLDGDSMEKIEKEIDIEGDGDFFFNVKKQVII